MARSVRFKKYRNEAGFKHFGAFLGFGIDCECGDGQTAHFSVALIEDTEGFVHSVSLSDFQFVDPTRQTSYAE